jgi:hypothetical protein
MARGAPAPPPKPPDPPAPGARGFGGYARARDARDVLNRRAERTYPGPGWALTTVISPFAGGGAPPLPSPWWDGRIRAGISTYPLPSHPIPSHGRTDGPIPGSCPGRPVRRTGSDVGTENGPEHHNGCPGP